jgi:hypothetical protein
MEFDYVSKLWNTKSVESPLQQDADLLNCHLVQPRGGQSENVQVH